MYDWAEFRHFRYLLAVLEKQGFRAAAEELRTAQPNLSVQAKQFQENASVRLYRKTKSGRIRVTETGVVFMALARHLLQARQEAIETLIAVERGELRSVRFGCSPLVDPVLFREFNALHRQIVPSCQIRPSHGDAGQLANEVLRGTLDAALVSLPLDNADLVIEPLRSDRLVCCMRIDSPLAAMSNVRPKDLEAHLSIFFDPERHPGAHERLVELLADVGVSVGDHSRATHPSELQSLVKDGHGVALIREGTVLDDGLTTRPISGTKWTLDMAAIYRRERHPKTLPILIRQLRRTGGDAPHGREAGSSVEARGDGASPMPSIRAPRPTPTQMNLLSDPLNNQAACGSDNSQRLPD